MEKKNFDYDDFSDSLIISRKKSGEKIQGSAEIGDLILDFTSNGKIVNVEIRHISKFLEMMKLNANILNELSGANLIIKPQKNAVSIFIVLKTPVLEQPIPLAIIPVTNRLSKSV